MTFTTESSDQNFVVFFDKVQTTVLGDEGGDLLTILDQLDTDTLPNSGVRLLGLDTDLKYAVKLDDVPKNCFKKGQNLPSRGRFLWREKHLRKDWPSILFPNGPSCSQDQPKLGCGDF